MYQNLYRYCAITSVKGKLSNSRYQWSLYTSFSFRAYIPRDEVEVEKISEKELSIYYLLCTYNFII